MADPGLLAAYPSTDVAALGLLSSADESHLQRRRLHRKSTGDVPMAGCTVQLLQDRRETNTCSAGLWALAADFPFFGTSFACYLCRFFFVFSFLFLFLARLPFASSRSRCVRISFCVILYCLRTGWCRIGFSLAQPGFHFNRKNRGSDHFRSCILVFR